MNDKTRNINFNTPNVSDNTNEDIDAIKDNGVTVSDSVHNSPKLANVEAINTLPATLWDFPFIEFEIDDDNTITNTIVPGGPAIKKTSRYKIKFTSTQNGPAWCISLHSGTGLCPTRGHNISRSFRLPYDVVVYHSTKIVFLRTGDIGKGISRDFDTTVYCIIFVD